MAKITRKTAQLFAIAGAGTDVQQFASFEVNGAPTYTTSPAVIMALPAWQQGWSAAQSDGTFAPYFQDRNAVDLVAMYQLAYLLQQGVAEWDAATTYYANSVVQSGGQLYLSLQDLNVGNVPPVASNALWRVLAFPTTSSGGRPTRTVLTNASGTYTPPATCVRIFARLVGGGGGAGGAFAGPGATAGGSTTLGALTAGGGRAGTNGHTSGGLGAGGAGGTASGGDVNVVGGRGGNGVHNGYGGCSKLGGAPLAIYLVAVDTQASGHNAAALSGSGGSAGGNIEGSGQEDFGGGGGAGGYVEATIYNPTAMAYTVGAGGGGGSSGIGSTAGGRGANGLVIIDEFYY